MNIVFANTSHIPGIIRLLQQVGGLHHQIRPDLFRSGAQKYNTTDLEELLKDPSRPVFIAEENGSVLGYAFCVLQITEENPVLCDRKALYIDDLCVDETCRGKHVGQALYHHVCTYAREIGCQAVTLNVWCGNDSAMAFYEKMGLRPQKIGMEFVLEDSHADEK